MPAALVVDRSVPRVREVLGRSAGWTRVGSRLRRIHLPDQEFADVRRRCAGVDEDRVMTVRITGQPMRYNGDGAALPTLAELRDRRDQPGGNWTGEGVLVGSVDTGVQQHLWLSGGYLSAPADFEAPTGTAPGLQVGHGTFITGLVLQQAPAAGVWVEKALAADGQALSSVVADAAMQLARRGVHVLNLSLGCFADDPNAREVMQQLVDDLHEVNPELVIVTAAGNLGGPGEPATPQDFWPAALDDVVAVGSVDSPTSTGWSAWSNRGPWVDLAAPGHELLSTFVDGTLTDADGTAQTYTGWARWSGTSFAAAVVAGAIARLMTGRRPITAREAVAALRSGAYGTGWTAPEEGVPAVPVVRLATWDEQQADTAVA
ncbi:S8 family peptidase [Modestobacter roseus]|uniref:Subtilase family protein n=1 Tax=Modestobacter roseus TaxID=1181884 RepID=A0A562ISQ3_9ACTN|nr:S8 family serine peptidase [Modestobacter roseus]TWH73584.1 subtilase family protein [Modestobacter roseus]